jgi:hypothetical protein
VMGRDAEGRRAERRGEGGIYGRRESGEAHARAFPDPGAAKPEGSNTATEIMLGILEYLRISGPFGLHLVSSYKIVSYSSPP